MARFGFRITAWATRPNLRVCESPHRGFAQQPQEVDQDAQQLRSGCRKSGLPTLLQQSGMSSPGMVVLCVKLYHCIEQIIS